MLHFHRILLPKDHPSCIMRRCRCCENKKLTTKFSRHANFEMSSLCAFYFFHFHHSSLAFSLRIYEGTVMNALESAKIITRSNKIKFWQHTY